MSLIQHRNSTVKNLMSVQQWIQKVCEKSFMRVWSWFELELKYSEKWLCQILSQNGSGLDWRAPPIPFKRVEQFPGPESYARILPMSSCQSYPNGRPSRWRLNILRRGPSTKSLKDHLQRDWRCGVCHVRWVMATNSSQMPLYPVSCFCEKVFTLCLRISRQNHCFGWQNDLVWTHNASTVARAGVKTTAGWARGKSALPGESWGMFTVLSRWKGRCK